jgi:hypothetical protein
VVFIRRGRLTAMRRYHQAARDLVGDGCAMVLADQVEAHVNGGGRAGGGEHLIIVDVEHVRIHPDARVGPRQRAAGVLRSPLRAVKTTGDAASGPR